MSIDNRPKLFLHVGTSKTGTTSLQKSLSENTTRLLSMKGRVSYCPLSRYETKLHNLKSSMIKHSSLFAAICNEFFLQMKCDDIVTCEKLSKFALTSAKAEADYIKNVFYETNCKILVISNEGFSLGTGLLQRKIDRLDEDVKRCYKEYVMSYVKKHFNEFDIKVVIYLRCQDDYIESIYNQRMKRNRVRGVELSFENSYLTSSAMHSILAKKDWKTYYNYYSRLCEWGSIYGKENVIVRVYEKNQMSNGTVYDFYKRVLCLEDSEIDVLLADGHIENESIKRI